MKLDEIFTFENLYSAYKNCRMSKQHKGEVIRFESNLAVNLNNLNNKIEMRDWIWDVLIEKLVR